MKKTNIYLFRKHRSPINKKRQNIFFKNTQELLEKIKNKNTHIYIYDQTYSTKEKTTFYVNNHINKSGENLMSSRFFKEKFFYDITQIYTQHKEGVVSEGLGSRYHKEKKEHAFPCSYLPHIAVFLYINGYHNIWGRLINEAPQQH